MAERKNRKHTTTKEKVEWTVFQNRIDRYGAYLGGAFEAGGWMGAFLHGTVVKGKKYSYGNLGISLNDSEEETMIAFQSIVGGKIYKEKGDNSWALKVSSRGIPLIASAIENYAPSRSEFIALALLWDEMTIEERIEAVTEFKDSIGPGGRVKVDVTQYQNLVRLPEFLAGVVDARGKPAVTQRHGVRENTQDPSIRIGSPNRALLEAIQIEYGGVLNEAITGIESKQGITLDLFLSHRRAFEFYRKFRFSLLVKREIGDETFRRYL